MLVNGDGRIERIKNETGTANRVRSSKITPA